MNLHFSICGEIENTNGFQFTCIFFIASQGFRVKPRLECRFADDVSFEKLMQLPKAAGVENGRWVQTCSKMQVSEVVDKKHVAVYRSSEALR